MRIEEKIERYLVEAQIFDVGDFIKQEGSDFVTYAQIVEKQKGGGYKVAAFTSYDGSKGGKAGFKSTKNWYPKPETIDSNDIPKKILDKILNKSGLDS